MLLTTNTHKFLSENVLELLRKKDVHSVLDFLRLDNRIIQRYTALAYPEIIEVKKYLSKTFSAPPINGLAYNQKILATSALIPTGILELDGLLQGGLFTRTIYEFCGTADSDKLHFILTILTNVVCKNNRLYFLDPKRDLSVKYIKAKLAKVHGQEESLRLLSGIRIKHISNKYELISALFSIKQEMEAGATSRIIIIHSISTLFLTSKDHTENNNILNHLANILRYLAIEHNMVVIVTNLITTWTKGDFVNSDQVNETIACGRYWQGVPNVRIKINKKCQNSFELSLVKYNNVCSSKKCNMEVAIFD